MSIEAQKPEEDVKLFGVPKEFGDSSQDKEKFEWMRQKGFLVEKKAEEGTQKMIDNAWEFQTQLVADEHLTKNPRLKEMFFGEMNKDFANQFLYEMNQKFEVSKQEGQKVDWDKWAKNAERLFDKKKYDGQIEAMKTAFGPAQTKLLEDFMTKESKLFIPSTLGLPNLTGKTGGEKPTQVELIEALKKKVAESGLDEDNQRKILQFIGNWHNVAIELPGKKPDNLVAMNQNIPPILDANGLPVVDPNLQIIMEQNINNQSGSNSRPVIPPPLFP